jgi:hypothetical protein
LGDLGRHDPGITLSRRQLVVQDLELASQAIFGMAVVKMTLAQMAFFLDLHGGNVVKKDWLTTEVTEDCS